ncbi:MAG: hypothetical protein GKR90_00150 [Pseudomonadales bacterium]|nr:hypothetical protein [Pseudomonadales bacterium]
MKTDLDQSEKTRLYEDGYVIIRNAIDADAIAQAKSLIESFLPKDERRLLVPGKLATDERITGLFTESCVQQVLETVMGPFPPVLSCQVAVTPPFNKLGGVPGTHVDGGWSGELPEHAEEIDPQTNRPIEAERYFGKNDERRGANDGLLWMDPERTLSYGSYTTLVGIALNDQLELGNGQFAVLKGLHEEVEDCFREQRDKGDIVGPEGYEWPRIRIDKAGRPYNNGLPNRIRKIAGERAAKGAAIESWPWPELTPINLHAGDAIIALHSLPHTPTPNLGPNPRMNIYFRVRRLREGNPNEGTRRVAHGVSDHPDRGYFGQFLEYPEHHNPWATTKDALCDHWSEWDGMQELVAARRQS